MQDNLSLRAEWTLTGATLTAVAFRGRVFNERELSLVITEGRFEHSHSMPCNETREVWEYQLSFLVQGGKDSNHCAQHEASIAIVGSLADGRCCKIHGAGFVGRDDQGQIEGCFLKPPRIEIAGPETDLVEWDRTSHD